MGQVRALLTALSLGLASSLLAPARGRDLPAPPASRPTVYDPDLLTCQPATIRTGFARQLQPYADQSEAVLQSLRQVQADLTRATLRRCVSRGLMDEPTALALSSDLLGDQAGSSAADRRPAPRRPQLSPASTRP